MAITDNLVSRVEPRAVSKCVKVVNRWALCFSIAAMEARRGFNGASVLIWKFRSRRVAEGGYAMHRITGWAQVNGFHGDTAQHARIEGHIKHDIHYIENWSLLSDLWILVLTVFSPMSRSNAQ